MVWTFPVSGRGRVVLDYAQIILGAILVGLGTNLFSYPIRLSREV